MVQPDYWPPLITAGASLLGAIVGALAATGGQYLMRRSDRAENRRALAYGLASEIESYLDLMERRRHVRNAEDFVQRLRKGENLPIPNFTDHPDTSRAYFPLFHANMSSLGILGAETCRLLATFHREIDAVRATAEAAARGEYDVLSTQAKVQLLEQELEIWRGAVNKGKLLVQKLYKL